jgi:hypothetical protein
METTGNILSFEEFSAKTDTATAEPTTDTVDTEVTDTEADTEVEDTETDAEETTDTEETEEEETTEESEEVISEEEPKTVAEMMNELKDALKEEAKAYESDDYEEHTSDTYMKENAALAAAIATKALEEMNESDEEYTKEAYEATCNTMKEAYAKKIDEACEAYGAELTSTVDRDNEEIELKGSDAIIAEPTK